MRAPYGVEVGLRVSRRGVPPGIVFGVLGLIFHHFSSIFRVLGASGASWVRSCVRWAICFDFERFRKVLGGFGEGFGEVFASIFCIFIENADFVKNCVFPRENQ